MAGAEEVVAAIERRDGAEYAGLVLNEKGYERLRCDRARRDHVALAATESFSQRNANASRRGGRRAPPRMIIARARDLRVDGDDQRRVRLSVRGPRRPGRGDRARAPHGRGRRRRGRPRRHDRRRDPAPGRDSAASRTAAPSASTATTRATPASRTPTPRSRPARRPSTRRSAASAAARSRRRRRATSRPRTSSTCSRATASRPASTSTR